MERKLKSKFTTLIFVLFSASCFSQVTLAENSETTKENFRTYSVSDLDGAQYKYADVYFLTKSLRAQKTIF